MKNPSALRRTRIWYLIHKWTSLVCTVFLLLLCLTGLPLIFSHEIAHALGNSVDPPDLPGMTSTGLASSGTPRASLDPMVATARAARPDEFIRFVSQPRDEPNAWFVSMGLTPDATESSAVFMFDARTGALLHQPPVGEGLMYVLTTARAAEPTLKPAFVAFPGTPRAGDHHYVVFMRGDTPLTLRLIKPVLLDARTGEFTASRDMPWYITALRVSQPLHFGDYGGLPLQILWAALDALTIIVLGSGLYLWWKRRRTPPLKVLRAAARREQKKFSAIAAPAARSGTP